MAFLPYRFKAGGDGKMPGPVASGHSHRPTTKVSNKAFKSRTATKGALRRQAKGMYESRRISGDRFKEYLFYMSLYTLRIKLVRF